MGARIGREGARANWPGWARREIGMRRIGCVGEAVGDAELEKCTYAVRPSAMSIS